MKILIFNWRDPKNPKSGGAEYVTKEHANYWVKKGNKVTWFCSLFPGSKREEYIDGIKYVRRGNSFTVYLIAPFYYLVNRKKIDFIVDEIHGLPFFTPLYSRKPKVAFIHEVAGEIWDSMYPFPINNIGKFFEYLYFKVYRHIYFWTDANSTVDELVSNGINKKKCIAIPCPISNKTVKKIPIKEKIPTFIFVSRIVKMKGIEEVIKAFFYIIKEIKNAQLWIVGDGDNDYIKYLIKTMNRYSITAKVKFWGKVSEQKKLELMKKATILLHASVKEGWGLVVIEAASQATPSIVYNVNGLKDSVINDKTGIVLKINTANEMAKEATGLLKDIVRYNRFQINCLERSRCLKWEDVTKQSLNMLERIYKKELSIAFF